jgi:hypothetical protein
MKTQEKSEQKDQAKELLLKMLKKQTTIYTSLVSVSSSGMYRRIRCYIPTEERRIEDITYYVAKVLEYPLNDKGIGISGCGMDSGFALVNALSYLLFSEYKCLGKDCGAAVHFNDHTPKDGKTIHKDGYRLSQKWL